MLPIFSKAWTGVSSTFGSVASVPLNSKSYAFVSQFFKRLNNPIPPSFRIRIISKEVALGALLGAATVLILLYLFRNRVTPPVVRKDVQTQENDLAYAHIRESLNNTHAWMLETFQEEMKAAPSDLKGQIDAVGTRLGPANNLTLQELRQLDNQDKSSLSALIKIRQDSADLKNSETINQSSVNQLSQEMNQLNSKKEEFRLKLIAAELKLREYFEKNGDLEREVLRLNFTISSSESQIRDLQTQRQTAEASAKKREDEFQKLETKANEDYAKYEKELKQLKTDNQSLSDEKRQLEAQLAKPGADVSLLNARIASLENEKSRLETEQKALTQKYNELNTKNRTTEDNNALLILQNAELRKGSPDASKLGEENTKLSAQITTLQTNYQTLEQQLLTLQMLGKHGVKESILVYQGEHKRFFDATKAYDAFHSAKNFNQKLPINLRLTDPELTDVANQFYTRNPGSKRPDPAPRP